MRKTLILFASVMLAGCAATGIQMTDEEAAACKAQGCTAWTEGELRALILEAFQAGLQRGAQNKGRAL